MTTIIKKSDAQALQQAQQISSAVDMDKILELQRLQMQQEQLRYMQTLRTGKPAGPAVESPKAPKVESSDVSKVTKEIENYIRLREVVMKEAETIKPHQNPIEVIANGPMGEGIGKGIGSLITIA